LNSTSETGIGTRFLSGQRVVLWVLWLTYGSFYFCRNNLGVALPGLQAELGYTKSQLGTVLMALKLAYGVGQFINGQMAEHWRPRQLLALGLLASAALNVVFGWATGLFFLTFIWACNGYVQALGWPPTMRVAANWFPALQRGRAIGIIGTGYQLCGALTFLVAGWAAEKFGWRGALYVPALLVAASAVHMLVFLKDSPDATAGAENRSQSFGSPASSLRENLAVTLTNPALWLVAVALCLLDACRYGFTGLGRDASERSAKRQRQLRGIQVCGAAVRRDCRRVSGRVGDRPVFWRPPRAGHLRTAPHAEPAGFGLRSRDSLGPGLVSSYLVLHRVLHFRSAGSAGGHAAGGSGAARHRGGCGGVRQFHGLHGRCRR
jgi:hypothetical protein